MKTILLNTILVASLLAGCSTGAAFLRADVDSVELSAADVTSRPVNIASSASWMIDTPSVADWLAVNYATGDAGLLWIGARSRNESLKGRSAKITIISGDGLTLVIPVSQSAMNIYLDVTPTSIEPFGPRDGTPRVLEVATDLAAWEAFALGGDWLSVSRGTEQEGTANLVTVSAKPTRMLDLRRDTIVIRPVNEAFWAHTDSLAVEQAGIDLLVDTGSLNLETGRIELSRSGGEVVLSVYSKAGWELSTDASPERVAITPAKGDADIEYGTRVVMEVAENTDTEDHTFTLRFTSGGETYEYTCIQESSR